MSIDSTIEQINNNDCMINLDFIYRDATWLSCHQEQSYQKQYEFLNDASANKVIATLILLFEDTQRYLIDRNYALDDSMRYVVYALELTYREATEKSLRDIIERLLCICRIFTDIEQTQNTHAYSLTGKYMHNVFHIDNTETDVSRIARIVPLKSEQSMKSDQDTLNDVLMLSATVNESAQRIDLPTCANHSKSKQWNNNIQKSHRMQSDNQTSNNAMTMKILHSIINNDVRNMICIALPDVDFLEILEHHLQDLQSKLASEKIIIHNVLLRRIHVLDIVAMMLRACAYSDFYDGLAAIL